MLYRILILSIFFSFNANSKEEIKRIALGFIKVESTKDPSLQKNEAIYKFNIRRIDGNVLNSKITYSIDGKSHDVNLNDGKFKVKTIPGKHKFQVYINSDYYEMYSDSLSILGSYIDSYDLYPQWSEIEIMTEKPVIYLYPEEKTDITVKVKPSGSFSFTYPAYNDGWHVTAYPDGTITHKGEDFNYLFWEGTQKVDPAKINYKSGYIIDGDKVTSFLEEILNKANFTAIERADFITYWAPRMIGNDRMFIQFVQDKDCIQYASLNVTPKPKNLHRFYMIWTPIDEAFKIGPQIIQPIKRDGFTVLEWGGQEIKRQSLRSHNQVNLK